MTNFSDKLRAILAVSLTTIIITTAGGNTSATSPQIDYCTPAAPGLISWWSGDGNALDARSRNDGTLQNGVGFAAGQNGQAFHLDGIDDFIQLPNNPSLNPTSITIEGWVNADQTQPNAEGGFIFANRAQNVSEGFSVGVDSDQRIKIVLRTAGGVADVISLESFQSGVFQHIAVTYDGTSGTLSAFLNGDPVSLNIVPGSIGGPLIGTNRHVIGERENSGSLTGRFKGLIDELSIYSRALTADEIAAIYNADTAGKCKPTATVAPSGLMGWWAGDGNANDISGNGQNGAFVGPAKYAIGKVGQAIEIDGGQHIEVPDNNLLDLNENFSIEMWAMPKQNGNADFTSMLLGKGDFNFVGTQSYGIILMPTNRISGRIGLGSSLHGIDSADPIPLNEYSHIIFTKSGTTIALYINGVLSSTATVPAGDLLNTNQPLIIGGAFFTAFGVVRTASEIDEVSLYDRALTPSEITSIFNAGAGGKLKTANTPAGFAGSHRGEGDATNKAVAAPEAVVTQIGDVTITFDQVTTGGVTQQVPLAAAGLPPLHSAPAQTLIYDVSTSAVFTGNVGLCFNVPSFTTAEVFATLFVLHLENGIWTNRTTARDFASRQICAQTSSLSPFAIAPFAPTSANGTISGRVATLGGRGIANASVTITGGNLTEPRRSLTNAFGYYQIDGLPTGQTYIVEVRSRRYFFKDPVRVVNLDDSIYGLDFFGDVP